MWEWLASPIDPDRAHDVGAFVSWHARLMVLGWGVLAPLAVFAARFFKVMPGQDWPRELDNQTWWRSHWMGQAIVVGMTLVGLMLIIPRTQEMSLHNWLGYVVLLGVGAQIALGLMRGTKGGPTAPGPDGSQRGDHYDMTPWRRAFEHVHKTLGYGLLLVAAITILAGLGKANAPVWMWIAIVAWWLGLIAAFIVLQRRGHAVDTYQAIWGDDLSHPGNQRPAPGWGMRRALANKGDSDVRNAGRDRVRSP